MSTDRKEAEEGTITVDFTELPRTESITVCRSLCAVSQAG